MAFSSISYIVKKIQRMREGLGYCGGCLSQGRLYSSIEKPPFIIDPIRVNSERLTIRCCLLSCNIRNNCLLHVNNKQGVGWQDVTNKQTSACYMYFVLLKQPAKCQRERQEHYNHFVYIYDTMCILKDSLYFKKDVFHNSCWKNDVMQIFSGGR